jgi:flavin-dependent dehydrogenase
VERLEAKGNAVTVAVGGRSLRARVAALATGKHNLRGLPRASGRVTAFKVQAILTPAAAEELADRVQLTFFGGGYVGICRIDEGLASICWHFAGADAERLGSDWRLHLNEFARRSPAFGDIIAGATFTADRPAAISGIPFGYVRRSLIGDSVFPVGDQIAVIPPFTGDGTSLALASGMAAARTVLAGGTAGDYQSAWIKAIGAQFRLARLVNGAVVRPWAARLVVGAAALFPPLATVVARATRSPALVAGSSRPAGAPLTSGVASVS